MSTTSKKGGGEGKREPTQEQLDELEKLREAYDNARKSGSADVEALGEKYHDFATDLMIDLSGWIDPGPDQEPDGGQGGTKPEPKPGEPSEPGIGSFFIKDGGWGADVDPKTWTVASMADNPALFKVIDNKSKNVATDFKTVELAANYIAWYIRKAEGGGTVDGEGGGGTVSGDLDKFGIVMIKPSAKGGRTEYDFKLESKQRNYASGKKSEWSCEYTNDSKKPIQNVEATVYEKINGFKTNEPDSISLKLGGPNHSDGNCCWVIPDYMTDGSSGKTMEVESPHPKNHGVNPKPLVKIGGSLVGRWFGYKGISQQNKDGSRHVESWIHFPVTDIENVKAEQGNWRQYFSCDLSDKNLKVDKPGQYFEAKGSLTTSRLDGVTKQSLPEFRYASVREIDPV